VKIRLHRSLRGVPKTLHVRRQGRHWTATVQCAGVPAQPLSPTARKAGFDLGVANLAASSDGEFFENPRRLAREGSPIAMVAYKAEDAGRELIVVNPKGTSQRCSNRPSQAVFRWRACGFEDHADVNAARNILWLGLSLRRQKREAETSAA
jgi:transposase